MRLKPLLTFSLFFTIILNLNAQDKKLELIKTIIGKDRFYGHIYDANAVNKRLLIVRVDENMRGNTNSKYILVDNLWRLKDEKTRYQGNEVAQPILPRPMRLSADARCLRLRVAQTSAGIEKILSKSQ